MASDSEERSAKIARVVQMCTEGFCNVSIEDKHALAAVLFMMREAEAKRDEVMRVLQIYEGELPKLRAERDEAVKTRNLAQTASTRNLEAKRVAEADLAELRKYFALSIESRER